MTDLASLLRRAAALRLIDGTTVACICTWSYVREPLRTNKPADCPIHGDPAPVLEVAARALVDLWDAPPPDAPQGSPEWQGAVRSRLDRQAAAERALRGLVDRPPSEPTPCSRCGLAVEGVHYCDPGPTEPADDPRSVRTDYTDPATIDVDTVIGNINHAHRMRGHLWTDERSWPNVTVKALADEIELQRLTVRALRREVEARALVDGQPALTGATHVVENLPALVREKRQREGMSHEALGEQLGVAYGDLCRFELGKKDPRLSTVVKLVRWVDGQPAPDTDRPLAIGKFWERRTPAVGPDCVVIRVYDGQENLHIDGEYAIYRRTGGPATPGPTREQVQGIATALIATADPNLPSFVSGVVAMTDRVVALFGRSAPEPPAEDDRGLTDDDRAALTAMQLRTDAFLNADGPGDGAPEPPADEDDEASFNRGYELGFRHGEENHLKQAAADGAPEPPETQR